MCHGTNEALPSHLFMKTTVFVSENIFSCLRVHLVISNKEDPFTPIQRQKKNYDITTYGRITNVLITLTSLREKKPQMFAVVALAYPTKYDTHLCPAFI